MLGFLYTQQVTSESIFELAIQAIVNAEGADGELCESDAAPIVGALCNAYYHALVREEDNEAENLTDSKEESEQVFTEAYYKAWPEAKHKDMGEYPESIPYEGGLPCKVLAYAASIIAERDRAKEKAWFDWWKANHKEIPAIK